jgi:hypothetical protein
LKSFQVIDLDDFESKGFFFDNQLPDALLVPSGCPEYFYTVGLTTAILVTVKKRPTEQTQPEAPTLRVVSEKNGRGEWT